MAAKVKLMKLLQEIRGLAEITARRPPSRAPGLFLVQLRSHLMHTTHPFRKRIAVDGQEQVDIPFPVKITHLGQPPLLNGNGYHRSISRVSEESL
jgi:hypothetical protein